MEEIPNNHLAFKWNLANNKINYQPHQPQLVFSPDFWTINSINHLSKTNNLGQQFSELPGKIHEPSFGPPWKMPYKNVHRVVAHEELPHDFSQDKHACHCITAVCRKTSDLQFCQNSCLWKHPELKQRVTINTNQVPTKIHNNDNTHQHQHHHHHHHHHQHHQFRRSKLAILCYFVTICPFVVIKFSYTSDFKGSVRGTVDCYGRRPPHRSHRRIALTLPHHQRHL